MLYANSQPVVTLDVTRLSRSAVTCEFWGEGFSLPSGGALGCASGRFDLPLAQPRAVFPVFLDLSGRKAGTDQVMFFAWGEKEEREQKQWEVEESRQRLPKY